MTDNPSSANISLIARSPLAPRPAPLTAGSPLPAPRSLPACFWSVMERGMPAESLNSWFWPNGFAG